MLVVSFLRLSLITSMLMCLGSAFSLDYAPADVVYGAGDDPRVMLLSDLNADGLPDLITLDYAGNQVGVRLASATAVFLARSDSATLSQPSAAVIGDVTGDGKPDLVVTCRGAAKVSVYPGLGNGQFGTRVDLVTGTQPSGVGLADLDGDGDMDVVVSNSASGTLSLLRSLGGGAFAAKVDVAISAAPSAVIAVDLNRDNKTDLAVTSGSSNVVSVLLRTGDFTFAAKVDYAVGTNPVALVIADPDHNGLPDLVSANRSANSISVLLNAGDGTFAAALTSAVGTAPEGLVVRDLDGDGEQDIATANNGSASFSVVRGFGDGTFAAKVDYATGTSPRAIVAGDCDGNHTNDLVVACSGNDGALLHLNRRPTFATPRIDYSMAGDRSSPSYTYRPQYSIATADLDGDGKVDVVMANDFTNSVDVKYGLGDGTFGETVSLFGDYQPNSLAIGDVNNDGKLDIVAITQVSMAVFLGRGGRQFTAGKLFYTGHSQGPQAFSLADVNLDGKLDALVAEHSNAVFVWLGQGNGDFVRQPSGFGGYQTWGTAAGDLTGDGKPDLVSVTYDAPDGMYVQPGVGDGTFAVGSRFSTDSDPFAVKIADLNGDNKLDIVVANEYNGTVSIFLGNGAGGLSARTDYPSGNKSRSVVVADVNGDGKPDVLTANYGTGYSEHSIGVLLNNGNGTFQTKREFTIVVGAESLAVADLNGDGKLDVIATGHNPRTICVLLGQGDGNFAQTGDMPTAGNPSDVALVDLNHDGRPDMVVTSRTANNVSVRLGQSDGGFAVATTFSTGGDPRALKLVDLNGDGHLDLVTVNFTDNTVSRRLGNGVGGFGVKVDYATGAGPVDVESLDFNGDGKVDLVVAAFTGDVLSLLLGNGDGTFAAKNDVSKYRPIKLFVGDINGDGKADVASASLASSSGCELWYGNITPWWGGNTVVNGTFHACMGRFADVNGDGKLDVLFAGFYTSGYVGVGLGNGDGTFSSIATFTSGFTSGSTRDLVVTDIDRDHRVDIVVTNLASTNVSVLRGLGDGTFVAPVDLPTGLDPVALAVADVNGDLWPDIAVVNSLGNSLSLLRQTRAPAIPDTIAPAAVSSLAVSSASATSIALSWTAPGDDGASGTASSYDLRYATTPITIGTWDTATQVTGVPMPLIAGSLQTKTVNGLSGSMTYYFAIKASDETPNISTLSNVVATTPDTTAPAAVTNLAVASTTLSTVTLTWSAPGDDGASGTATAYEVRYSTAIITAGNWSTATMVPGAPVPGASGVSQTMSVSGLNAATRYYFALKTTDEVPNHSALSNVPDGLTLVDTTAPANVVDLAVTAVTATTISLQWTAPGDDGAVGTASTYAVRWAGTMITPGSWPSATIAAGAPTPGEAGTIQTMTISGLVSGTPYFIALTTSDEVPNTSGLSNVVSATPSAAGTSSPGSNGSGGGGCGVGGGVVGFTLSFLLMMTRLRENRQR